MQYMSQRGEYVGGAARFGDRLAQDGRLEIQETEQAVIREALIADVDRVAQQLEAEHAGIAVRRAQAVRVLLLEAIRARKAQSNAGGR
jgi:hypothetical protein